MDPNVRTIFTFRQSRKSVNVTGDDTCEQETSALLDGIFLSLVNKNGKLGAAYYNFAEKTLNVYEEMSDLGPQYLISSTIYREISPKYILTFGNQTEQYVKAVIDFFTSERDTTRSSTVSRLPENFYLASLKEFAYESCKTIVSSLNIASNTFDTTDFKQEVYFQSNINLNNRLSVQALGALCKYLQKHWSAFGVDPGDAHFLHIYQVTLKNHVLLDNSTFKALQIFSQISHDAGFKRGQESACREGLSIYKMFIYGCRSKMGQTLLKKILSSPINDRNELEKRLNFIKFVQNPAYMDFINNVQDNIKHFRDISYVTLVLGKIQNAQATNRDWNTLHKMIYHTIFINDISKGFRNKSEILVELNKVITEDLLGLQESISNALDFNTGNKRGRPIIKFGLDSNLDAKLLHQQDVAKHVTSAARFAVTDLPDYINECKVVYLPEMGHLMAIKEWESNCDPEQLQYLDYQFMFSLGGVNHYKNPLCVELDKQLGDINAEIIDHENRILRRLSTFALKYNKDIRDAFKVIALIDCLIAMAKVSQQNNYVQPELNDQRIQEIEDCKHPLMEQIIPGFRANSFYSGGSHTHIHIITGANGSGKSVYLKQVLLTVYLAHIGCYVPAKKANIGLVDSIHCRMHLTESVVVRLSSFMTDITQSSQALHYATPSSLIIMDEFGRGTLTDDGLIMLVAFLKSFLVKRELCPHVMVSTHLQRIATLLPETRYLEHCKMEHTMEDGTFCFLHKLSKGVANSFAFDIASTILPEDKIETAKSYFKCLQQNVQLTLPNISLQMQQKYLTESISIEPTDDDSNMDSSD